MSYFCVFVFTVPRKCSVVGCRGNYASRKGEPPDVNKVSVFRFPKDECKKQEWLRRIPQELVADDITDSMVVCEKQFEERVSPDVWGQLQHFSDGNNGIREKIKNTECNETCSPL